MGFDLPWNSLTFALTSWYDLAVGLLVPGGGMVIREDVFILGKCVGVFSLYEQWYGCSCVQVDVAKFY